MIVEIRGKSYHVSVQGDGIPLVLLHGFTGDGRSWDEILPGLSGTYRTITVDLLGHGKTESPDDPELYLMEEAAADLAGIIEKLGLGKVHLLGYSMGGRLALGFAALYPGKVRSLILESSSPGLRTEGERKERMKSDGELAAFILREGIEAFVGRWEDIPLFASQKRLTEAARLKIRQERLENDPAGLANSLAGMGTGRQPSFWDKLGRLGLPVLLICGSMDEKFCNLGARMKESMPDAELSIVENAGHAIHVEEPAKFGTIVNGFLNRLHGGIQ